MNLKIFPATIIEGQKVPLIRGWREAATTDPAQIKLWQDQFRDRIQLWGAPCGSINGFFALDIDVKTNGFQTVIDNGFHIPNTTWQRTMNGGCHYLFKHDPTREIGNKVGFLKGLDIRSEGGWIGLYGLDFTCPIIEAPDWIYEQAMKRKVEPISKGSEIKLAPEIAQGIIEGSLDRIRNAPEGESNNILNTESFKIGQLVASLAITREVAEQELFKAAKDRGKPDYESKATIKSGLDGGMKNPLTCPFPPQLPVANIPLPTPPEMPERWTPRHLTRDDLLNTSNLRKPQLFKDWSTEDISITTADGGTGKTTLKLNEAICLALGERFLGFDCKQQGKTLFITGEDTDKKLAAMLGAIMRQMGLFEEGIDNEQKVQTVLSSIIIKKDADLCLIAKDKQGFLYPNPAAMEKLLQAVADFKPKMIVFDPIASFWGSESMLNDMNKAVTKFMSELVDKSKACVEMINHMGKQSSANKDMTQFAGRGGSGLPSNARVSRVLRGLSPEEVMDFTGKELIGEQSAMLCNVNKFSDGSPLWNKPFVIVREGYLFRRESVTLIKAKELESEQNDKDRVWSFIKECRTANKYPTRSVVEASFMGLPTDPISKARIKRAIDGLVFSGVGAEKLTEIENPVLTVRERALIITDMEGREI